MHPAIRSIVVLILPIVSILLILIGFYSSTSAQLPPEIRTDAYLLQVEQAIRDRDQVRARTVIRNIRDLREQHDLDLADDFHFRYAKAAAAVGMSDLALESVVTYLEATGREGQHYSEALKVMNQVRAGSSSSDVPAQLAPGIRADAYLADAEQAIRDGDLDRAKNAIHNIRSLREQQDPELADDFHFRYAKVAADVEMPEEALEYVVAYLTVAGREGQYYAAALQLMNSVQREVSCRGWDSEGYFKTATTEEVTACLDTGIDVKTINYRGVTPLHRAMRYTRNPDVIKGLINAGADTEARDEDQRTPLHWGAWEREQSARVSALLASASEDLALDRLTSPQSNNAWEKYQAVLALAPGHRMASAGLDGVVGRYVSKLDASVQEKDFDKADEYVSRIQSVWTALTQSPGSALGWRRLWGRVRRFARCATRSGRPGRATLSRRTRVRCFWMRSAIWTLGCRRSCCAL